MTTETLRPNGFSSNGAPMAIRIDGMRNREAGSEMTRGRTSLDEVSPTLSIIMISGGTGGNCFATPTKNCMHVLPISDDGGSSREILRVLGGPSVGDIRSRLIRLIPGETESVNTDSVILKAIHNLLSHRFPTNLTEKAAREQWADVVEGRSSLWKGIPIDRRECLRSFLAHFQSLVVKRANKKLSFRNFCIGNGFLAGARDMLGGLPSAIFMFQALTDSQNIAPVIPVIVTNQALMIAAELSNGTKIVGQSEISHPAPQELLAKPLNYLSSAQQRRRRRDSDNFDTADSVASSSDDDSGQGSDFITSRRGSAASSISEGGFYGMGRVASGSPWNDNFLTEQMVSQVKISHPIAIRRSSLRNLYEDDDNPIDANSLYVKGEATIPLESPIKRVYYVNNYSAEIFPEPNPTFLEQLGEREVLIYSAGSLWTSIIPCLALRGMATAIATSGSLKAKILLLNCKNDRETLGYAARDYIDAIVSMLNRANKPRRGGVHESGRRKPIYAAEDLISHLIYLEAGEVEINPVEIRELGIEVVKVPASGGKWFSNENVKWALTQVEQSWG